MAVVNLALGALFYQGLPGGIGVTADRSYREAPQAPGTTTSSIVDLHRYGVSMVAPRPRHHPTRAFLPPHRDSHLSRYPLYRTHRSCFPARACGEGQGY